MPIRPTRDPQSEYDRNSNLAEAFGWVLLAGLAVERAFAFVLEKPPVERYSTIAEDVLIVGGVWGEIHFARHARSAGDKLQAGAAARIAEAEARGKEADQKAAEAQLELARFRAKREITTEQREEAAGRLRL
jgi:hypothetical protein